MPRVNTKPPNVYKILEIATNLLFFVGVLHDKPLFAILSGMENGGEGDEPGYRDIQPEEEVVEYLDRLNGPSDRWIAEFEAHQEEQAAMNVVPNALICGICSRVDGLEIIHTYDDCPYAVPIVSEDDLSP